jgi:hypothetical protein
MESAMPAHPELRPLRPLLGWIPLAALLSLSLEARAADPLPWLSGPITLDGRPEEEAWRRIPPLPMLVYEPAWGAPPHQLTEVRVGHDGRNLYLGAVLLDTQPEEVRVGSLYRDRYSGDEAVGIIVDGFNDDKNAMWFYTTPAGVRGDMSISDDLATADPDWSWNGYWHAAAVRTERGWSAEVRIPFSTLGFQAQDGAAVMGLSVYRWLARWGERQVWPPVAPRWALAFAKPSKLADVSLVGVQSRRALYLSPYLLGGYQRRPEAGEYRNRRLLVEPGGDVRLALTSNLTLDLSVNTDFAQVEADDAQINLSRFPLFFPEKRQFFLERADIFAFPWEGKARLFNSRSIGLRDGQPIRIYGGARLAGRLGQWDLGLLDMQTAGGAAGTTAGENLGVVRVRRRLSRSGSSVGALVTTLLANDRSSNVVGAADADLRIAGDDFFTMRAAGSSSIDHRPPLPPAATLYDGPDPRGQRGIRWLARWQRRSLAGLSYEFTGAYSGAGYRSDLGFEERSDVAFAGSRLGHLWLLGYGARLAKAWLTAEGGAYRRNRDGRIESARASPAFGVQTTVGHQITIFSTHDHEDVVEPFRVAGLAIPAGVHRMHQVTAAFAPAPSGWRVRPGLSVFGGSFYGGRIAGGAASLIVNPNGHLEAGFDYQLNAIGLGALGSARAQLGRLRLQLALDTHASLTVFTQYNSGDGTLSLNARARYHVREGTDVWLVYDEGRTSGPLVERPMEDGLRRALLVKLSYTWAR